MIGELALHSLECWADPLIAGKRENMTEPKYPFTAFRIREVQVSYLTGIELPEPILIHNSRDIYIRFRDRLLSSPVEVFEAILLNSKNAIMGIDRISIGSLNSSTVHPREVFSKAVKLHAAAIILMHNHPSGDPAPSREDRACTERLYHAGLILGIRVLDHIVFGDTDYYSFADSGAMTEFPKIPGLSYLS
jgi:DNA repair protein RadC